MGQWQNRAKKIHNRKVEKTFSKPFRKRSEKDSRKGEKMRIREAQRHKYSSIDDENEV